MTHNLMVVGLLVLALAVGAYEFRGVTADRLLTDDDVIREIEKLGGSVTLDEMIATRPIVAVDLGGSGITDAGLKHFAGLTQLKTLDLHDTKVTDAGLESLKSLHHLQMLFLHQTTVTDAGLERLKGLTQLQWLCLSKTHVTDAGLKHLAGMPFTIKSSSCRRLGSDSMERSCRLLHIARTFALNSASLNPAAPSWRIEETIPANWSPA